MQLGATPEITKSHSALLNQKYSPPSCSHSASELNRASANVISDWIAQVALTIKNSLITYIQGASIVSSFEKQIKQLAMTQKEHSQQKR